MIHTAISIFVNRVPARTSSISLSTPKLLSMSWVDYDGDGHSDTSERDIRRHPLSYSSAFEEDPSEPDISFPYKTCLSGLMVERLDEDKKRNNDLPFTITVH